jgi:hypothetical protein
MRSKVKFRFVSGWVMFCSFQAANNAPMEIPVSSAIFRSWSPIGKLQSTIKILKKCLVYKMPGSLAVKRQGGSDASASMGFIPTFPG